MSAKELYCYGILKSYSLIVDFDGEVEKVNVPAEVEGETFKHWKTRVLGDDVENVTVYAPFVPASNRTIRTLKKIAKAGHLENVFRAVGKKQTAKKRVAVQEAKQETVRRLSTISKDTLKDIFAATEFELEPSVREFFGRLQQSTADDIDVDTLLMELVNTFNRAVRSARQRI